MQRIVRTLVQLVPILILMSITIFTITVLLPGDPTDTILGEEATEEQRAVVRGSLGMDDPLPVRYINWVVQLLSGDFGRSYRTKIPVNVMISERIPVTLQLSIMALLISVLVGIPAGILAARRHNSRLDTIASLISMFGVAMPHFWMGILLIQLFSLQLRWLPPSGYIPFNEDPIGSLRLMIMPSITVGLTLAATVMRQTRASLLEVLTQDYIRTARAKGLHERSIMIRHALRNAAIPVVTVIGLQVGALISGAVVTETVFSLPGLGRMLVNGIFQRDLPVIQATVLFIVIGVLLVNLITDLIYTVLDPRIRL